MAQFKGLMTTHDGLNYISEVSGQMILCSDTMELYFDTHDRGRIKRSDVIWFESDQERLQSSPIENKIYIVKSPCNIWSYVDGAWCNLSNEPIEGIFNEIKSDISNIKTDITNIGNNVTDITTDLTQAKDDIVRIDNSVSEAKTDITEIETSLTETQTIISEIKTEVIETKETIIHIQDTKSSKHYTITLSAAQWALQGKEFIQSPLYSEEIFYGTMYDPDVNLIVSPSADYFGKYVVIARPNADETALEFVTDILPTEDIIMDIIVLP